MADRTIGEAHEGGGGTLTVADILAQSSNVGSVMIGLKLGAQRFDRWVRRFGFGTKTGVDLPGEQQGIVLRPEDYSGSSMGNMPIGQGIAVTPIQMATAYTAIANGGVLREPYVRRRGPAATQAGAVAAQRRPGVEDARGGPRRRGDRRGGLGGRLHPGGQDRNGREGRGRRLLQDRLRGLLHRLRARARTRGCSWR